MFREVLTLSFVVVMSVSCLVTPEVAGAEFPPKVKVAGHELTLNGIGARKKTLLQLYLAGLYLTENSSDPAAIIAADVPMALRIEVTSGFVSQEKMVTALKEGFERQLGEEVHRLLGKQIYQFQLCFSDKINKGDIFEIVYIPAKGTFVVKNGTVNGAIEGLGFKRALFGIWLSDKPVDQGLKHKMLGR